MPTVPPDPPADTPQDDVPPNVTLRGHDLPLEYHRRLLDDVQRVAAYERAIRVLVQPGDVVLDLGTGTGILAMLAARRGATVHAVESTAIARVASELVRHNGLDDRVTVHHADILEMEPVEPVDLLITECMGRFVVDDGMLAALDVATSWLKPGGRVCPARIDMWWAPVGNFELRPVELFDEGFFGLDLSPAQVYAFHTAYMAQLAASACLAAPARYARVVPGEALKRYRSEASFELRTGGVLKGIAGWFDAHLAESVVLSTAPGIETHWGQYVFPVPHVAVEVGDRVDVTLELATDPSLPACGAAWHWWGEVMRGTEVIAAFAQESMQRLGERHGGGEE